MKKILIIICVFIIVLPACKKVEKKRSEFIGYWSSDVPSYEDPYLDISENSYAYYSFNCEGNKEYEGIARANNNRLYIGSVNYFDIIEYPHEIDTAVEHHLSGASMIWANWKMVLKGLKPAMFHSGFEYTYYKADY